MCGSGGGRVRTVRVVQPVSTSLQFEAQKGPGAVRCLVMLLSSETSGKLISPCEP